MYVNKQSVSFYDNNVMHSSIGLSAECETFFNRQSLIIKVLINLIQCFNCSHEKSYYIKIKSRVIYLHDNRLVFIVFYYHYNYSHASQRSYNYQINIIIRKIIIHSFCDSFREYSTCF